MFCNQCQETLNNQACTTAGVCGKSGKTSDLQDVLVYSAIGLALAAKKAGKYTDNIADTLYRALFTTLTNVSFDDKSIKALIFETLTQRDSLKQHGDEHLSWSPLTDADLMGKAPEASLSAIENEDIRSLTSLVLFGLKGVAAYAHHAMLLGVTDAQLVKGVIDNTAALAGEHDVDGWLGLTISTGDLAVKAMAALDKANTEHYGHPEATSVYTGTKAGHGILVSGHDLLDLEELLEQTKGTGINIYTHGEMLPANAYPFFKKYSHLAGNYGTSWWRQREEMDAFSGPILFTTNCIQRPKDSYKSRVYTTGLAAFEGCEHIADRKAGKQKDFSKLIKAALDSAPLADNPGEPLTIGFARNQVLSLADKVVDAVKSGAVKKFVVMAGCDGHHKTREYFTEIAEQLPQDNIILTAGCAKYRYNNLPLGNIGGIPRVLDAGQCNDSYSLAIIAMALKDAFKMDDINDLPIAFDIAWYEQKAVAVLLALLVLGFKNVRLGPTLPAFLSPTVAGVLVEKFNIMGIGTVEEDLKAIAQ